MKIVTILGARPQFIKAAPISKVLYHKAHTEYIIHTGQHYDIQMSEIFFKQLNIPGPACNLGIGSGSHGWQTGKMLIAIEKEIKRYDPDVVMVYGDTNTTIAGALAAVKLSVPIAHVEAGLRSFNREMPEEHNRILTDHCSTILFCPTQTAVNNLKREGIVDNVNLVGDTMYDAVLQFSKIAEKQSEILELYQIQSEAYIVATIHRPYNTDNKLKLLEILEAFIALDDVVIFPIHPRTRAIITKLTPNLFDKLRDNEVKLVEPLGYLDMLKLVKNAKLIITDSGGLQKEAYFAATRCITVRPETEWIETVENGWNILVEPDRKAIVDLCINLPHSMKINILLGMGLQQKILFLYLN